MILPAFTRISASNNAFLTGAEIGGVKMRKKAMVSRPYSHLTHDFLNIIRLGVWNVNRRRCGLPSNFCYPVPAP